MGLLFRKRLRLSTLKGACNAVTVETNTRIAWPRLDLPRCLDLRVEENPIVGRVIRCWQPLI